MALAMAVADAELTAEAVVVDHQLQPRSAEVAEAAAAQCRQFGLDARIEVVDVVDQGSGPEAAAREARYRRLELVADARNAAAVLLGHNADDQAETVLLGLVRGSGSRSLAGMPHRRGRFRRPFLDVDRAEIERALAESQVDPWQDPHNEDTRFTRVRVRRHVLPFLSEQLGPGVTAGLRRTSVLARADAELLDDWAEREFTRVSSNGMPVDDVQDLPDAVRWRVLRRWLIASGCSTPDLTLDHVLAVDELVTQWRGQGPLHLPGSVNVGRSCGTLNAVSSIPDGGSE